MSKYPQSMFRVLMHGHIYVDTSMLFKGIYETFIPRLYSSDTTIESLIKQIEELLENNLIEKSKFDAFKENISKCRLVSVYLETYEN